MRCSATYSYLFADSLARRSESSTSNRSPLQTCKESMSGRERLRLRVICSGQVSKRRKIRLGLCAGIFQKRQDFVLRHFRVAYSVASAVVPSLHCGGHGGRNRCKKDKATACARGETLNAAVSDGVFVEYCKRIRRRERERYKERGGERKKRVRHKRKSQFIQQHASKVRVRWP